MSCFIGVVFVNLVENMLIDCFIDEVDKVFYEVKEKGKV